MVIDAQMDDSESCAHDSRQLHLGQSSIVGMDIGPTEVVCYGYQIQYSPNLKREMSKGVAE